MNEEKQKLLIALGARLERCEHEVACSAVDWLEVVAAKSAPAELRESFRMQALAEFWRRDRLRELWAEVRAAEIVERDRFVYFLALDACDPRSVPSFRDWLDERRSTPPASLSK